MRYIFIVQGEGRGHMTQALSLAQILRRHGHTVGEVLVGSSDGREVPQFFINKIGCKVTRFKSPNFAVGKSRKTINLLSTIISNLNPRKLYAFYRSIKLIRGRVKESGAEVVINFYELMASLASLFNGFGHARMVGIAHQYMLHHPQFEYSKSGKKGLTFLRLHARMSSIGLSRTFALSFYPLHSCDERRTDVLPPLLRQEVLESVPTKGDYILGYMLNDGYADEIHQWHKANPETELHMFWDKKNAPKTLKVDSTLTFHYIDDKKFLEYMVDCKAYITTAGFESVCEALYLGKTSMMIPSHIEQQINAEDAQRVGAGIVADRFDISQLLQACKQSTPNIEFRQWVDSAEALFIEKLTKQ